MNKLSKMLLTRSLEKAREKLERSEGEQFLNLFNSGIVVDLKKVKIKAFKIAETYLKTNKKR